MTSNKPSSSQIRTETTRTKIINAARRLFIEFGFAGTSIGKIAASAQVNHSLIFHHFGNKEGLWRAVKESIVEEASKLTPVLPDLAESFSEFLQELITQNIYFYRNNPDIIRMINWQRLEADNKKEIGITLSPESKKWLAAFNYYQEKGSIAATLKVEFILTFILAIVSNAAMDPNVFLKKADDLSSYIDFCVAMILKALK